MPTRRASQMASGLALAAVLLAASPSPILAQARGPIVGPVLQFDGQAWEAGGWMAPYVVGDELQIVGTVTGDGSPFMMLPWDPGNRAYTLWCSGMLATSEAWYSGDRRVVTYSTGTIEVRGEAIPSNHDYGTNPPNSTAPATFADGELVLGGTVSATVDVTEPLGIGRIVLKLAITFDQGTFLPLYSASCGDCVVYVNAMPRFVGPLPDSSSPAGYDFGTSGTIWNTFAISVEDRSWGSIKAGYQR